MKNKDLYHKIQDRVDTYIAQEKETDLLIEQLDIAQECFMGEKVAGDSDVVILERKTVISEKSLCFALKQLGEIVPSGVCPIDLINRYIEDKAKAMRCYV